VLSKHREPGDSTVETILKSDPVGDAISSGHFFMGVAETGIYSGLVVMTLAFTTAGDIIGADGAAMWAMGWAFPMLGTLWVVGAVRAYILPVLPFIYVWMFAAMWLLAVLEAGIAMVVWAFGFARMNGDELLAEQSKMGTMLTFQVLLMPILGLLAYEACFILLPLIIGGIEVFWSTAFYGQTGGRVPSASSMGVGFVLITFLNVYLTMHLLGQIFHIPNHIMTWFGASGRDFGDKSLFAATAGAAAAALGRGMPGLPGLPKPKGGDGDNGGGKGGDGGGVSKHKNLSPLAAKAAEPKVLD
jgi:conjugal transfer/type IV secretion protein DotA/TraY